MLESPSKVKKKLVLEKLENFYISIIFTYLELEHTYTH